MHELIIPKPIFDEMLAHCRKAAPNEACGILAGTGGKVLKMYAMNNSEGSPVSYLMDSGEQFRVMKDIREQGLSMAVIFHSHPASAAYPSPKDVSLAFYEDVVYVIAGLAGNEPDVKAFSISGGEIREVGILVEELP
jgi:proteasome lid subunit RPN8/RPN11